jgi:hypothetical protein
MEEDGGGTGRMVDPCPRVGVDAGLVGAADTVFPDNTVGVAEKLW